MKTIGTILMALIFTAILPAQNFKFGKVSEEELMETQHPLEADASASYLYNYRNTYFITTGESFQLVTEVHQRIKIYTKEGFDFGTHAVYLRQTTQGDDMISGLKASTYHLENGKIVETKMEKDAVFDEAYNKYINKRSFALPALKEGVVLEFRYKITSPFIAYIPDYQLQFGIPVKKLEAYMSAPDYFKFKPTFRGFLPVYPDVSTYFDTGNQLNAIRNTFLLENVPSLKEEGYVDNINNYRAAYNFELNIVEVPGRYFKNYSQTWDDVVASVNKFDDFKTELDKTGYYKDVLPGLVDGLTDPVQKAVKIYHFVRDRMNWNEYYGYTCDKGVRKAWEERTGNVADINLMLTSMLRSAGLEANPVLVSTKKHGKPMYPTTDGFNYVISQVAVNGKTLLLDATEKYGEPGLLPHRAMNWYGRMVKPDNTSAEISLSAPMPAREVYTVTASLNADGSAQGKMRYQCFTHKALEFRKEHLNQAQEQYLEYREKELAGIEIDEYQRLNEKDLGKPVTESFSFVKEATISEDASQILFSPMLFLAQQSHPFSSDKRQYPVDFVYPSNTRYMINITLPEGYEVAHMPESGVMAMPDNLGKFSYNLQLNQNVLQLLVNSEINADIVPQTYYDALKGYLNEVVKKETEQVVLKKV